MAYRYNERQILWLRRMWNDVAERTRTFHSTTQWDFLSLENSPVGADRPEVEASKNEHIKTKDIPFYSVESISSNRGHLMKIYILKDTDISTSFRDILFCVRPTKNA